MHRTSCVIYQQTDLTHRRPNGSEMMIVWFRMQWSADEIWRGWWYAPPAFLSCTNLTRYTGFFWTPLTVVQFSMQLSWFDFLPSKCIYKPIDADSRTLVSKAYDHGGYLVMYYGLPVWTVVLIRWGMSYMINALYLHLWDRFIEVLLGATSWGCSMQLMWLNSQQAFLPSHNTHIRGMTKTRHGWMLCRLIDMKIPTTSKPCPSKSMQYIFSHLSAHATERSRLFPLNLCIWCSQGVQPELNWQPHMIPNKSIIPWMLQTWA